MCSVLNSFPKNSNVYWSSLEIQDIVYTDPVYQTSKSGVGGEGVIVHNNNNTEAFSFCDQHPLLLCLCVCLFSKGL